VAIPKAGRRFDLKKLRELKVGERGVAALELALILPMLLIMAFWVIDFGRLIQARLIVTNVSREGGSLASRDISFGADLLQSSGAPLDLNGSGRIYVSKIKAGTSITAPDPHPNPYIDPNSSWSAGSLGVSSVIGGQSYLGLSPALYNHLVFNPVNQTSDIAEVWVVEVYYKYKSITPLPKFIQNILITPGYDGMIIGSKSVF
jgi:hypothetical protein